MTVNAEKIGVANGKALCATQHRPWWYYAVYDAYERVNVWSHGIPGVFFLLLGISVLQGWVPGSRSLAFFALSAAVTHLASTVTHLFPTNAKLRKVDHVAIVVLMVGTSITALWAFAPDVDLVPLWGIAAFAFVAAFFPRVTRTCCFMLCAGVLCLFYGNLIVNGNIIIQMIMYFAGGACFIRNGGHTRPHGLTDHHFLHYFVTMACILHCFLLISV